MENAVGIVRVLVRLWHQNASECIRMHQKYRSMSNPNNIGTCNNVSIGFMHIHAQFGMNLDHSKDNWDQLGIFQDVFLEIA